MNLETIHYWRQSRRFDLVQLETGNVKNDVYS